MLIDSMEARIGQTPLLHLHRYTSDAGCKAELFVKLEMCNGAGSVKDRVAKAMLDRAEAEGKLRAGGTVIEPTSGNTGIGIAALCAMRGYRAILTMPESMSIERRKLLAAYGAEIVLTKAADGMQGAVRRAEELVREIPGAILAGQFDNPANPQAHFDTTGPEIWQDMQGQVDVFVAGVGTGGTVSGIGGYLKSQCTSVKVVAVEPERSPLLSQGISGPHGLQGIGANFVPANYNAAVVDQIVTVSEENAYAAARKLATTEGLLAGITSGASLWAATQLAQAPAYAGKRIVVLLPDTGERYLSTPLWNLEA